MDFNINNNSTVIQTHRGNKHIEDIFIGDRVYNFITGKEETVMDIVTFPKEDIYKVTYTDRRQLLYRRSELIYLGDSIMRLSDIIKNGRALYGDLKHYPIYYNINEVIQLLSPDPYIAGALLIHGDRSDKWINLPLDRYQANSYFSNKFQLNYALKLNGKAYFSYNGSDKIITWKEFFPHYNMKTYKIILDVYNRALIKDRWQFIRGIFDLGYDSNNFPDSCSITHKSEEVLKAVQMILWSLGVISTVIYNPISGHKSREYSLNIESNMDNYPGFFYDVNNIETMMEHRKRLGFRLPEFKVQIKHVEKYARNCSNGIVLNEKNTPYVTSNFLPLISL